LKPASGLDVGNRTDTSARSKDRSLREHHEFRRN
jgi:hypothetical protein